MSIINAQELTPEEILDQIKNASIVFLAPRFRHRNIYLSGFAVNNEDSFFYTLQPSQSDLRTFLSGFVASLREISTKFGSQTSQSLPKSNPKDLADAVLTDIAKTKYSYIILDNFDYLTIDEDAYSFFERLFSKIPKGTRIVINSRELAFDRWIPFVRSGQAVVLGDDKTIDGGIFDPNKKAEAHLEVYGLAGGGVYVNGQLMDTWDGPLPRNLFYYFVDHPMITRDEIFTTFWPDLPTKEATNVFHVTKRKISERLGYELTSYSGGFYRPSDQMEIHYDVHRFEAIIKDIQETRGANTKPEDWFEAIKLYRTPFLQQMELPWIKARREQLKLLYAETLINVGRIKKSLRESDSAISYYLRALREVPEREDIHRDIMTLYASQGQVDKAVEQYNLLVGILKRKLNIMPSKSTRDLFSLLTGQELYNT